MAEARDRTSTSSTTSRRPSYTRYPRAILWLLRGGRVTIGGLRADVEPFYIGKTPITNRQFEAYDPGFRRLDASSGDDDPAVGISYDAATGYCAWYAEVSRKPVRLPTEIEWEYACRGGEPGRYFFGNDPDSAEEYVWDLVNCPNRLQPLQAKKPNGFGLYGMLGGVWEWVEVEDGGETRVLRGGSFRVHREELGCGVRRTVSPGLSADDVGFRIVRDFRR